MAQQLLARHGIVMRETATAEGLPGGYSAVYPALRTMEDSGKLRRGMFIAGLGASQFALPAAVDMLRGLRQPSEAPEAVHLAATDPANPYGTLLAWPRSTEEIAEAAAHGMARVSSASVVLVNGRLAAFLRRKNPALRVFLPEDEPERTQTARALAAKLAEVARERQDLRQGLLIAEINDAPARRHLVGEFLVEYGFMDTAMGFQMRRRSGAPDPPVDEEDDEED